LLDQKGGLETIESFVPRRSLLPKRGTRRRFQKCADGTWIDLVEKSDEFFAAHLTLLHEGPNRLDESLRIIVFPRDVTRDVTFDLLSDMFSMPFVSPWLLLCGHV
jgi:hypothetical protein